MYGTQQVLEAVQDTTVFQLVYISAATHDFTDSELEELLANARRNNLELGLSGMLIYHENCFIQVLEGPENVVQQLFSKIEEDPRHANTRVLFKGEVKGRSFKDWTMGFYRTVSSTTLDGLNDFLPHGFLSATEEDPSVAHRALLAFRDGKWRQSVDS